MVEFKTKSDEFGPLMDMHPHTRGKLKLLKQYYKAALPIFSNLCMKNSGKTIIVDAFSGSGKYDDGSDGSPIVLLRVWNDYLQDQANKRGEKHKNRLVEKIDFIFNDIDEDTSDSLQRRIENDSDLKWLLHHIEIENKPYKDLLTDLVMSVDNYAFGSYFIDPYGYSDVNIDEIAGLAHRYGHEVIVNWMFENIAKYTHANKSKDTDEPHQAQMLLDDMFGEEWRETIREQDDLVLRKEKLTKLFEDKTKEKIDRLDETGYVIPFMFYKDGDRVWYPMFHISTSPRGAQVFNKAANKIGAFVKKYHPEKTREDQNQTGLDSYFGEDVDHTITEAERRIKENIKFFKNHFLDLFSYNNIEIEVGKVPMEFLRIYPRRSTSGNSNVSVNWNNEIIPEALKMYPENLSITEWDGKRRIVASDIIEYKATIEDLEEL